MCESGYNVVFAHSAQAERGREYRNLKGSEVTWYLFVLRLPHSLTLTLQFTMIIGQAGVTPSLVVWHSHNSSLLRIFKFLDDSFRVSRDIYTD